MNNKVKVISLNDTDNDILEINQNVNDDDILKPDNEDNIKKSKKDKKKDDSDADDSDEDDEDKEEKEEDTIETRLSKKSIINKINRWKLNFPEVLENIKYDDFMKVEELKMIEQECEFAVATSNCGDIVTATVSGVATAAEIAAPYMGLKLQGYQQTLMSNPQFNNTLKELSVKYSDQLYTDPFTRLTISMLHTGAIVHMVNMNREQLEINKKMENKNINIDMQNKFNEL
jgi:hypothetical protein